jgi:hypothetical protein
MCCAEIVGGRDENLNKAITVRELAMTTRISARKKLTHQQFGVWKFGELIKTKVYQHPEGE